MSSTRFTAAHWRDRAEEARTIADQMTDSQAKASLLNVARGYDQLAVRYEATEANVAQKVL